MKIVKSTYQTTYYTRYTTGEEAKELQGLMIGERRVDDETSTLLKLSVCSWTKPEVMDEKILAYHNK